MYRFTKGNYYRKSTSDCACGHPQMCHYTKDGSCIYQPCECKEFKSAKRALFHNRRARCEYGHSHDSGEEIKVCFELYLQKKEGQIQDYVAQKTVDLLGPSGAVVGTYKVDFIVYHLDGSVEFVEAKGRHLLALPPWPLKWALLQDKHRGDPKYKFRVVYK
jgi:hypothetical protein